MPDEAFIDTVRREAAVESPQTAEHVSRATLEVLGARITDGEATTLATRLPDDLGEVLVDAGGGEAESFSLETFLERICERADVDEALVVPMARAVATALDEHTDLDLADVRDQLPSEYDLVFEPAGPYREAAFLETVRDRAGLSSMADARDATVATLRTLGERLSEDQAMDLALYVPKAFEAELVAESDETPTEFSIEDFFDRVAERASVDRSVAERHARAVGSTLAETASEREIATVCEQLPDPYGTLFRLPAPSEGTAA